jgi:hypothetical protein
MEDDDMGKQKLKKTPRRRTSKARQQKIDAAIATLGSGG